MGAALLAGSLIGCAGEPPPPPPDIYTSRGLVRQLPSEGPAHTQLYIHHETIPEFKDQDGQVIGMESMAMPFSVAETADLADLNVGDKVTFTFEVRWQGSDPLRVTAIDGLAPDVRLDFELPDEDSETSDPSAEDETQSNANADDMAGHDHGVH